ncbi:MAG: helix-turn-helix transcriptional regulator [Acidobacteria bacterium]|nr:helix-turn-helix transcriptional regulator [Acidobacteriota bacterium]
MKLEEIRKQKGFRQTGLDEAAGLRRGTVNDIERGKNTNPSWFVVCCISSVLKMKPEEVFPPEEYYPQLNKNAA